MWRNADTDHPPYAVLICHNWSTISSHIAQSHHVIVIDTLAVVDSVIGAQFQDGHEPEKGISMELRSRLAGYKKAAPNMAQSSAMLTVP